MLVLLTRECCAYELTPVNKRIAKRYEKETGHESVLFQVDWDYPSLAQSLGWNIVKAHKRGCADTGSTDGTIDCGGCGRGASHFIAAATEFLDKREGDIIRADVEYFS